MKSIAGIMNTFTNFLFVPASKPERFEKAMDSGADLICIDMEDSVPASAKDSAREDAIDALKWLDLSKTAVRINGIRTAEGLADLLALRASDKKPCLLFIPMVEHTVEIEIAKSVLGGGVDGFVPLIDDADSAGIVFSVSEEKIAFGQIIVSMTIS